VPTRYTRCVEISEALPGAELIRAGFDDLANGIESKESLLVLIGAPPLARRG